MLIVISSFGHNTQKREPCLGPHWNNFTLYRQGKLLPWDKLWWHSLGDSQPHVRRPGISNHHPWKKGSWASTSCDLLAKSDPLAAGLRQEHRLQHMAACCPVDYLGPFSKSENVSNQNLQDCPGFVPRCNLRWDTDLHNFSLSHLLSSLSACYFWE